MVRGAPRRSKGGFGLSSKVLVAVRYAHMFASASHQSILSAHIDDVVTSKPHRETGQRSCCLREPSTRDFASEPDFAGIGNLEDRRPSCLGGLLPCRSPRVRFFGRYLLLSSRPSPTPTSSNRTSFQRRDRIRTDSAYSTTTARREAKGLDRHSRALCEKGTGSLFPTCCIGVEACSTRLLRLSLVTASSG